MGLTWGITWGSWGVSGSLGVVEGLHGVEVADRGEWSALQQEDLVAVGHTLLQLACGPLHTTSVEACASLFSAELTSVLAALTNPNTSQAITSGHQVGQPV